MDATVAISEVRKPAKGPTHRIYGNRDQWAVPRAPLAKQSNCMGSKAQGAITTDGYPTQSPLWEVKIRFCLLLCYFLFCVVLFETQLSLATQSLCT